MKPSFSVGSLCAFFCLLCVKSFLMFFFWCLENMKRPVSLLIKYCCFFSRPAQWSFTLKRKSTKQKERTEKQKRICVNASVNKRIILCTLLSTRVLHSHPISLFAMNVCVNCSARFMRYSICCVC